MMPPAPALPCIRNDQLNQEPSQAAGSQGRRESRGSVPMARLWLSPCLCRRWWLGHGGGQGSQEGLLLPFLRAGSPGTALLVPCTAGEPGF